MGFVGPRLFQIREEGGDPGVDELKEGDDNEVDGCGRAGSDQLGVAGQLGLVGAPAKIR